MAEYSREQRNQLSRAIANSDTGSSAVLLNDNSNYQSAANHWNLLKMTKAPGELSDGRVLTTDGRYKPGRDGYQVQATDYDAIIQAPSLE